MKNIKENVRSARPYFSEVLVISVLLFFIVTFLLYPAVLTVILCFLTILIFDLLLLNRLGAVRSRELQSISLVISSIRNNEIASSEEIRLGSNLLEVEEEIRAMFLRTQTNIEALKRLEKVRTQFLANVSHELRTPIFAIQGFIETLLDGAIDDQKVNRKFLQKANQHTENLNNLLNDLIDISMIESGEMHLSFRYFKLYDFLSSIAHDLRPLAESKQLQLNLLPLRENLQVLGDKNKLKQVFVNLIQNAIKYTEEGSVTIIAEEMDKSVLLKVSDTGIGIPDKYLDRIFERFFRVDKGRSREVGGTGLGLAIVKHIVEAHGSRVGVKSRLGQGTEFYFTLNK